MDKQELGEELKVPVSISTLSKEAADNQQHERRGERKGEHPWKIGRNTTSQEGQTPNSASKEETLPHHKGPDERYDRISQRMPGICKEETSIDTIPQTSEKGCNQWGALWSNQDPAYEVWHQRFLMDSFICYQDKTFFVNGI